MRVYGVIFILPMKAYIRISNSFSTPTFPTAQGKFTRMSRGPTCQSGAEVKQAAQTPTGKGPARECESMLNRNSLTEIHNSNML